VREQRSERFRGRCAPIPKIPRVHINVYKGAARTGLSGASPEDLSLDLRPLRARIFARKRAPLTVHRRDHNPDNNPPDGSNWELLCLYCHDNEHWRYLDSAGRVVGGEAASPATHQPFADLKSLLKSRT
jgi:hypothetical protein